MDHRFCAIYLPALVMTRGGGWLDRVAVSDLCGSYRVYNDYDYDAEDVRWERVRLRRTRVGKRKALVVDYRERMAGFSVFSLITYSDEDTLPVRCYTFCADVGLGAPAGGWLREHHGDMTSTRLQRYDFDVSWHTLLELVRIHEREHPLLERLLDSIFPDV